MLSNIHGRVGCGWEGVSDGGGGVCEVGLEGGAYFNGREHGGCQQTDWGNTWQKSQLNKRERRQRGRQDRGIF